MSWKSKHSQVVDTLRSLLQEGEWQDTLPGYRALEQLLGVSRPTIEKALSELTEDGLLGPAEVGKSRKILPASKSPVQSIAHGKALLILSPVPIAEQPWTMQLFIDLVSNGAREEGRRVTLDHFPFQQFKNPHTQLERLMKIHRPDRIVVLGASREVAKWLQAQDIPFFTLGGAVLDLLDTGINGCGTDRAKLAALAAGHLISHGHNRMLYPIPPMYRHAKDKQVALAMEWGTGLKRSEMDRLIPVCRSAGTDAVYCDWRKWLLELEPTAVIVQYHKQLLSLVGFCNKAGIHIPEDLSIISLSWEPSLQWMNPQVTAIDHPIDACAKWAIHWLRLPLDQRVGWRWFEGRLRPGGTVMSPRQTIQKDRD